MNSRFGCHPLCYSHSSLHETLLEIIFLQAFHNKVINIYGFDISPNWLFVERRSCNALQQKKFTLISSVRSQAKSTKPYGDTLLSINLFTDLIDKRLKVSVAISNNHLSMSVGCFDLWGSWKLFFVDVGRSPVG